MTGTPVHLLMVGLSGSGKTTYLAGLFHTLSEAGKGASLGLRHLPDEREYLLNLERRWLDLEEIKHSAHVGPQHVELPLRDASGQALDLVLPDVSGEEYGSAWEDGAFSQEIGGLLMAATGLLVFVHAKSFNEPELISVLAAAADSDKPETWEPSMAATQAQVCDLLEQISELREGGLPPVAVVISAWDSVEEEVSPDEWLPWNLPLLSQWLTGTDIKFPHKLFGISAQGGDLSDAQTHARLARQPRIGRPGGRHGLTEPVEWLLDAQ